MVATLKDLCRDGLEGCGVAATRLGGWLFDHVLIYFADVAAGYAIWEEPRHVDSGVESSSLDSDGRTTTDA